MIQIALIDDFLPFRKKISGKLESPPFSYKVYQYENGQNFINRFSKQNYTPNIVLMDIRMNPMNGYETTSWLTENYPDIPVLAFSDIDCIDAIIKISMCGAKGCTEKNISSMEQFNEIMKCIMNGGKHYDTIGIHKLVNKYLQMDKNDIREGFLALTNQENEVMKLADEEMTAEEKAKILNIKKPTFYKHVSNIYEKLNINKASSLRNLARKYGLID